MLSAVTLLEWRQARALKAAFERVSAQNSDDTARFAKVAAEVAKLADALRLDDARTAERNTRRAAILQDLSANTEKLEKSLARLETAQRMEHQRRKLLTMYPELSERAVRALEDSELDTTPARLTASNTPSIETSAFPARVIDRQALVPSYTAGFTGSVRVDSSRPAPVISIDEKGADLRPVVSIPKAYDEQQREALYYFEFDTRPDFTSPNMWRFPALLSSAKELNAIQRRNIEFDVLVTHHRGLTGRDNSVKFPFRASAMRLPDWDQLNYAELQKQSRALSEGLSPEQTIREVFAYVRQVYLWGNNDKGMAPVDVFRAGLASCGLVNGLAGALLEMSGIRYRMVDGFNPLVRLAYPGGGHTAIEALNPATGRWSYVDPYLDILQMNVSARELAAERRDIKIYNIDPPYSQFGPYLSVGGLFEYRGYFDNQERMPGATMPMLFGREEQYGKQWALHVAPKFAAADLFPHAIRIYVRARYIFAGDKTIRHFNDAYDKYEDVTATPWAQTSFVIPMSSAE
jgi:hypothetical protein